MIELEPSLIGLNQFLIDFKGALSMLSPPVHELVVEFSVKNRELNIFAEVSFDISKQNLKSFLMAKVKLTYQQTE